MDSDRFVLVWTIDGHRGAFCPSGGLTRDEAERAEERLERRALNADHIVEAVEFVPYVFDVVVDPVGGLS